MRPALLYLVGSSVLAQLLIVASTFLLTRHYAQETFGVFGIATTAALALSTLLSFKLEHSLHVAASPERLFDDCLRLLGRTVPTLGTAAFVIALGWIGPLDAALVVLYASGHGVVVCAGLYLNFHQRFRAIAALNLLVPIVFVAGAVLDTSTAGRYNPLLLWQGVAYGVGAALALGLSGRLGRRRVARDRPPLRRTLAAEFDNLVYLVPSFLCGIVSVNVSVIGAAWLFDARTAGLVVVAQRAARAPVGPVAHGLNEALRSAIPDAGGVLRRFDRIALLCLAGALAMLGAVWALPERFYAVALGPGWTGVRPVLLAATVAAAFQLIATSVHSMLSTFDKRSALWTNASLVAAGAGAVGAAWLFGIGAVGYLWIHSAAVALVYVWMFALSRRRAGAVSRGELTTSPTGGGAPGGEIPLGATNHQHRDTTP